MSTRTKLPPVREIAIKVLPWLRYAWGLGIAGVGNYNSPRISSEVADCSLPLTFDQHSFCSMGCLYCFSSYFKIAKPGMSTYDRDAAMRSGSALSSVNTTLLLKLISGAKIKGRVEKALSKLFEQRLILHWGGLADPFCEFERANNTGLPIVKALGEYAYPCLFSFKGGTILDARYRRVFERYASQRNFAFQVSMTTYDKHVAARLEIGVPSPAKRIRVIKMLSDMGYWTILRLRPYIIGITDQTIDELLDHALAAGVRAISTEFFCLESRADEAEVRERYGWLGELSRIDDFKEYYYKLSPTSRGSYKRLNRNVKERFIRRIYEFCLNNNLHFACSDPDFKELNMSGCCCGLPAAYPANEELTNWTAIQQTEMMRHMRQEYWKRASSGESNPVVTARFTSIYSEGRYYELLRDRDLANFHVKVMKKGQAYRRLGTLEKFIREEWNEHRSPACPYHYFHGKLSFVGVDKEGDVIYKYVPSSYEFEWVKDGIDLSKE